MFKDRLRLLDLLERLGLLNTPQTVIQAVQKALKSAGMGEFLVTVALFFDQHLPNLFPRDARIQKRRLELEASVWLWGSTKARIAASSAGSFCSVRCLPRAEKLSMHIIPVSNSRNPLSTVVRDHPNTRSARPPTSPQIILGHLRLKHPSF
jgi:hypothetical protein